MFNYLLIIRTPLRNAELEQQLPQFEPEGMTMAQEVIRGLVKAGLAVVGIPYTVEVLAIYAKSGANYRPALDRTDAIHFVERLLIWAGVVLIAVGVKLGRAVLDTLTETSADLGEWAIARHAVGVSVRTRERRDRFGRWDALIPRTLVSHSETQAGRPDAFAVSPPDETNHPTPL